MEWVETTARSVEEAKDAALDQLGIDEQEAEFEIVEEPRAGLFGRVRGEARVRARVAPKQPRPRQERQRRSPRASRSPGPDAQPSSRSAPGASSAGGRCRRTVRASRSLLGVARRVDLPVIRVRVTVRRPGTRFEGQRDQSHG